MNNTKQIYSALVLLVAMATVAVVSCKRDLSDLEQPTYPTTPEVFIDGFSEGLIYAAFGGSKVTAFDVDPEVKYQGTAAMKFAVPDAGDPQGAYAGGGFFTSVARDLSDYDALTFWAKSSQPATLDVVGFGNICLDGNCFATIASNLRYHFIRSTARTSIIYGYFSSNFC